MLLYRPILAVYQETRDPCVQRWLLRELACPQLHAEPDELLEMVRTCPLVADPHRAIASERLAAEVSLAERNLRLRLTTRDPVRVQGGLWTSQASGRVLVRWMSSHASAGELTRAAASWIGPIALQALGRSSGPARELVLMALGCLGPELALPLLGEEVVSGAAPGAAAVGLSLLDHPASAGALFQAVQARGLEVASAWLGLALSRLGSPETAPRVGRLARSPGVELRVEAARALEGFGSAELPDLLDPLMKERETVVRLHLFTSLARVDAPGGVATVMRLMRPGDHSAVRVAAIKAIRRVGDEEAIAFLDEVLTTGTPIEQAEALEGMVCLAVDPARWLARARQLAGSNHGRSLLVGLLALTVGAPEEASRRIGEILSELPSDRWFLAAYPLRYLKSDQTVPALRRLCPAVAGTDLEEIAVSAMCRHLTEPGAVAGLLELIRPTTREAVVRRILADLARHLTQEQAPEVAAALREKLDPRMPSTHAGPLLIALGALGTPGDLPTLVSFAGSAAVTAAIQGMELLMDPAAGPTLDDLVRVGRPGARDAALVALFRLGLESAGSHLNTLMRAEGGESAVARPLTEMALLVRCSASVSRLALLHRTLTDRAREPSDRGEAIVAELTGAAAGPTALLGAALPATGPGKNLDQVLSRPREGAPAADAGGPLPALGAAARPLPEAALQGSAQDLYRTLGTHLTDLGWQGGTVVKIALPLVLLVVLAVLGVSLGTARQRSVGPAASPGATGLALPPLLRVDGSGRALRPGDVIEGTVVVPVQLATRLPENRIHLVGRLRVVDVQARPENPRSAEYRLALLSGTARIDFPRGRSRVWVETEHSTVVVGPGSVSLDLSSGSLVVTVSRGAARATGPDGSGLTLRTGHRARFRAGRLDGRVELLE
ncbi:MAG: HEAT repeat domain-containing protein [Candidatus Riflebacteria bacterium]|nr:HEAT repeat domain-containing protein [Candidatus Riflebacteria bacterium]